MSKTKKIAKIPDDILRQIEIYAESASDHPEEWRGNEMSTLIDTAKFGYNLATQAIETYVEFAEWLGNNARPSQFKNEWIFGSNYYTSEQLYRIFLTQQNQK